MSKEKESAQPKMTAIYECNPAWVERAILYYHHKISGFDYSEKDYEKIVTIKDGAATITVNERPKSEGVGPIGLKSLFAWIFRVQV